MESGPWQPRCEFPTDLVHPVRVDPTGRDGPTRGQAQRGGWRQCAYGWYVPADTDSTVVEQRILEQAVRIASTGGITGWAALRWRGAAYFDGLAQGGRVVRTVPLLRMSGGRFDNDDRAAWGRSQLAPSERELVNGIWCATVQRALFDEMRFDNLVGAVKSIEMAAAAGLISTRLMSVYVSQRNAWEGVPLVRDALGLSCDDSRSPQEVGMKIVWVKHAGLPYPLVNQPVFDLAGNLLGYPDIFEEEAGVVGEYDGEVHKDRERHRKDVAREQRYRDHGLEYFTVVGGDLQDNDLVVKRMLTTRRRALFLPPEKRLWTLTPPPWWPVPETLDARLARLGLVSALTHI
jgi:hypothetical protein